MSSAADIVAVSLVTGATVGLGAYGIRLSRTTSDFYVAARSVSPMLNASAIGGEYLSAASFLGVAGLILAYGEDMLWYPVGYTVGYLVLLLLVAAPLRRSGAYTLPDFAESRLASKTVRRLSSLLVVLIGWLYLMPQLQGASLTLTTATGAPRWLGGALVAVVVLATVVSGGMRSITFVQAFQYWLKVAALSLPLIFVLAVWHAQGSPSPTATSLPVMRTTTTVRVPETLDLQVLQPVTVRAHGVVDARAVDGPVLLTKGRHRVGSGTQLTLDAGTVVPQAVDASTQLNTSWVRPLSGTPSHDHPLYGTYSLVLATFLGTMGLPHVLVRFYTNPDGRAARRTTLLVLGLLSGFYLLPTIYGALARTYTPDLLLTGQTDSAVLLLPGRLVGGTAGELLTALVTAGAFAAFLSTSSGLTVSVAGVIAQDVLPRLGSVRAFRVASVVAVAAPLVLSLVAARLPLADAVGLAFAVAASSFCPLLVLGIWWRGLTAAGAIAGLVVGGGLATTAVLVTVATDPGRGWLGALLSEPAAWCVPLAFLAMVVGSWVTRDRIPPGTSRVLARMHTPEVIWSGAG
ncbi:MAG TPA: cation acetate symporter [Actinomycetes bacterium]